MAAGAYLLSFELVLSSDNWRRRASAMLPCMIVGAGWWISYKKPAWLPMSKPWRWTNRGVVILLIYIHFFAAPYLLYIASQSMYLLYYEGIEKPITALYKEVDLKNKTLLILNAPSPFSTASLWQVCESKGLPEPKKVCALSSGLFSQMNIQRVDARSLDLEP